MTSPSISVVVSGFNCASIVDLLLHALTQQTLSGRIGWEVVFVDNGSTDATAQVVQHLATHLPFPVSYVLEERKGKSFGVNTGIDRARGSIIALTDCDCIPAPDWLECLWRHFERCPDVACVGGRVEIYNPSDALITVRLSTVEAPVDISNFTPANIPIIGNNMAMRSSVFAMVGLFDTRTGPGTQVQAAEDVDMLYRLARSGLTIHYDPAALVLHNHGRRLASQIKLIKRNYIIGRGAFYCKYILDCDQVVLRWAYWELRSLLVEVFRRGVKAQAAESLQAIYFLMVGGFRYFGLRRPWTAGKRCGSI